MECTHRRNARFDTRILTEQIATAVHNEPDLWGHWANLTRRLQEVPTLWQYTYDQLHNYILKEHKRVKDDVFAKIAAIEEVTRNATPHGKQYQNVLAALQGILHNDLTLWSKLRQLATLVHHAGVLPGCTEEQVRRFLDNHRHALHDDLLRTGYDISSTTTIERTNSSTDIWQATVELMGLDIADGAFRGSKQDWGLADDIAAASEFRKQLRNYCRLPSRVCCVCAQRHAQADMHPDSPFPYSSVCTQLEALRTDIMSTPTVPRNGNTRWTHNGLQYHVLAEPWAGAVQQPDSSEPLLHLCRECVQALNSSADLERQVPRRALARCDVGLPPPWYEPLTLAEALLVAPLRAVRHMVLLSNPAIWRPSEQRQKALHGHCVTFLAPGPLRMLNFIPRRIADLPEQLHVALVGIAGTEAEAREQARRQSQCGQHPLHVNGQKVARWIWHIFVNCLQCAGDWGSLGVDENAVQELRDFSGLPESLLSSATVVAPGAPAEAVLQALRSDPVGYAQTRFNADPEDAHRQMGAPVPDATGSSPVPAAVQAMVQAQAIATQCTSVQPSSPQSSPAIVAQPDIVTSDLAAMAAAVEERAASVLQAAVHPLHSTVRNLRQQAGTPSSSAVAATPPEKRTLYDQDSIRANIRTALQGPNASTVRMHLAAHKWKDLAYYVQPPHGVDRQQLWRHFQRLGPVEYTPLLDEQPQPAPHASRMAATTTTPSPSNMAVGKAASHPPGIQPSPAATAATNNVPQGLRDAGLRPTLQASLPLHSARRAPVPARKVAWTIRTETAAGQVRTALIYTYVAGRVVRHAHFACVHTDLAQHLESLPYDRTAHIPTIGIFFQGIVYCFVDSQAPALHRITNNSAVGVSLVPHDLEPPLPSAPGLHLLRYVPKAIVVQPEGPPLGDVCSVEAAGVPVVPKGCILLSRQTRRFSTTFKGAPLSLLRTGLMLGDGYAVTDFASQGGNFGLQDWLAHLNPPDKGPISRATLFVILTRFRDWEALKLLAPLWRDGDAIAREAVHARLTPLTAKDPPLAAELQRLTTAAERQQTVTPAQISAAKAAAAAAAPLPEPTAVLPADAAPE